MFASHLRRAFTFHADLGSKSQAAFGSWGIEVTWSVFHAWKQFQQDGDGAALQQRIAGTISQSTTRRTSRFGTGYSRRALASPRSRMVGHTSDGGAQAALGGLVELAAFALALLNT
jgi:hypothetical protein